MNIERKVNTNEREKLLISSQTKKTLGLLAGGALAVSALIVGIGPKEVGHYINHEFQPVCEKKKTPQDVQNCKDKERDDTLSGQHMW